MTKFIPDKSRVAPRRKPGKISRMSKLNKKLLIGSLVILGLAILIGGISYSRSQPAPSDEFPQCIKDSGAIFYGAFWCPHCQNQKTMFGRSERLLPYAECSLPSGRGQTQNCIDEGIESYPTWQYPDGTRESGKISLTRLAEKTGCTLPANY